MSYAILYGRVDQRLKRLKDKISELEDGNTKDGEEWNRVREDLVSVTRIVSNLDNLSSKDAIDSRKHQNGDLNEECVLLMKRFTEADRKNSREADQRKRDELFGTKPRFGQRNDLQVENKGAYADNTILDMDEFDEREKSLYDYTRSQIGSYIDIGARALDELSSQKSMLMRARRKIINASKSMTLSDSVMTNIDRFYSQNKIIIISGILGTVFLMYLIVSLLG